MKIYLDSELVKELSNHDIKLLKHSYLSEEITDLLKNTIVSTIDNILHISRNSLLNDYMPQIKQTETMIPTDDVALIRLIVEKPDYKDADVRKATAIEVSDETTKE